jgi:DNA polymerase
MDARRPLEELHEEWEACRKCALGERRALYGKNYVRGSGETKGIMFVGEGPGVDEEDQGVPFIGRSGKILRAVLARFGYENQYITNAVSCRACTPILDADGNQRFRRGGKGSVIPMFKDEPPLPVQLDACFPRLQEEIYLVDPVVIVTLGATAAKTLLRRPVSITKDRGNPEHAYITGALHKPVITEKKKAWVRKVGGVLHAPTEPSQVAYLVVPTLHPAYVARQLADKGPLSAFKLFASDIRLAIKIYERYMLEVHGEVPGGSSDEACDSYADIPDSAMTDEEDDNDE